MSVLSAGVRARTLRVSSPAIPVVLGHPALEPVRLSGHEGLDSLFHYELLLKTPDALNLGASSAADFDLDSFIGREIQCRIELDGSGSFLPGAVGASTDRIGAGMREINALITEACLWGEEGRHVQYKLTLRPWLHLATLSTDCRIFQNQSVVQILDELLADYPFPVDKRLIETYPTRDYQTQFNESDFDFFSRLCQEWGISYFFEHSQGKHRLVLVDAMGAYQPNPSKAYQLVEYHAPGWKTDAEGVRAFTNRHGIKLIASEGPIELQAHRGETVLVAHKDVRITSIDGEIHVTAKKKVVVIGGGSYSEWGPEGITHGTAGTWMEHAAMHAQVGPMRRAPVLPQFANSAFNAKESKSHHKFGPSI